MTVDAATVRAALDALEPAELLHRLGVARMSQSGSGVRCACPVHSGKGPNLAVHYRDGRLLWSCKSHGCEQHFGGDALGLLAGVHGLEPRRDFPELLRVAADLAGVDADTPSPQRQPTPEPGPPRYPDREDVLALWDAGRTVREGHRFRLPDEVVSWLVSRGLDGPALYDRGLVVPLERDPGVPVPTWARRWWWGGYRVLLPMYDVAGHMRSLRARLTREGQPKALAPGGHEVRGLVLANLAAVRWLRGYDVLDGLLVVEGETDLLSAAQRWPELPAVGLVVSASWTAEIASRVPDGCRVMIATDGDRAGDRYAAAVAATLLDRCHLRWGAKA